MGTATVTDEHIRGPLRVGHTVQARHAEKKEMVEATITKIQDCSQYTVVFDDGDITTLRRTALCLKSGRHFNESETLDQLPLTHPEHWGFPVGGGRGRGRRSRQGPGDDGTDDGTGGEGPASPQAERDQPDLLTELYSNDIGKVVCVEAGDKKKSGRDNWFPGLVVVPSAQPTVRINVRDELLVRSFRDGRYYTVPRKEILEFSRDMGRGAESSGLSEAMDRALRYLDRDELPAHWERGPLFDLRPGDSDSDAPQSDSSDDEPREEKDHFVAQLYKFMDDRGTPLNKNPSIANKDIDLYRLFKVVHKLSGYNRVTNQNKWRSVAIRLGYAHSHATYNSVKQAYKKYLLYFEDFYRKLGCTMINHPRNAKKKGGRSLIRDKDRATPSSPKPSGSSETPSGPISSPASEPPPISEKEAPPIVEKVAAPPEPPEPPDTSNSSSDADNSSTPRSKRLNTKTQTVKPPRPPQGERVKALIDKFEEQAAKESPPEQHTRSKSVGPQRQQPVPSGRATPAPRAKSASATASASVPVPVPAPSPVPAPPPVPVIAPPPASTSTSQEVTEVKRGRKKKEGAETQPQPVIESPPVSEEPALAAVGDKLKVYYGPTHESKVL